MFEFTGERVIPGQVEPDLWNEHRARYAFAARRVAGRRVLDAGCGAGYGSALLAEGARAVVGLDVSREAVEYAREHYARGNLRFLQCSCSALPFGAGSFDLAIAFEVIEHLEDWSGFLLEVRRVLAPDGEFIVSTPNRSYYAESRRRSGPNPYHVHEFDVKEFTARLGELFPNVTLYAQNHVEGIGFQPVGDGAPAEAAVEDPALDPAHSHFFLAVCAAGPQPPAAAFFYLPRTANLLRERELHIEALENELAAKNEWLEQANQEKQNLVEMFRSQTAELERSNRWAEELEAQLRQTKERVVQLQQELAEHQEEARQTAAGYEAKIAELDEENRKKTEWALETERRLGAELEQKCRELVECVRLLDQAEATLVERTAWAQRLDAQVRELEGVLEAARASRWVRLGRLFGLGPVLGQS